MYVDDNNDEGKNNNDTKIDSNDNNNNYNDDNQNNYNYNDNNYSKNNYNDDYNYNYRLLQVYKDETRLHYLAKKKKKKVHTCLTPGEDHALRV